MSFGVGQFMSRSVQANLELKGKRKTIFDRKVLQSTPLTYDFDDKKMTPEELVVFKEQLKRSKKRRTIKIIGISTIIMLCLCTLLFLLNCI